MDMDSWGRWCIGLEFVAAGSSTLRVFKVCMISVCIWYVHVPVILDQILEINIFFTLGYMKSNMSYRQEIIFYLCGPETEFGSGEVLLVWGFWENCLTMMLINVYFYCVLILAFNEISQFIEVGNGLPLSNIFGDSAVIKSTRNIWSIIALTDLTAPNFGCLYDAI